MAAKSTLFQSVNNIFKTPILLSIYLLCIVITVTLVAYSKFNVLPVFSNLMIKNIEVEAQRITDYLAVDLLSIQVKTNSSSQLNSLGAPSSTPLLNLSSESLSDEIVTRIQEAQTHLKLEKLKIFDAKGKIIYSTDKQGIGTINTNSYFLNQVANGEVFSKIVKKNSVSSENELIKQDVAEVYVPIMIMGKFQGALEIYYNISQRKTALEQLISRELIVIYLLSIVLLISVGLVLNKASVQMIDLAESDHKLQQSKKLLEKRVSEQTREINQTQKISIKALATLAEHYDADTGGHLNRIQSYVELLAKWLVDNSIYANYIGAKRSYVEDIKLACLLHDVGKIAVPSEILNKQGELTEGEFKIIKTHTTIAGKALSCGNEDFKKVFKRDSYLALASDIALYHHEKWNGEGYPHGLIAEAIPLSARIVAVADVYDALRSHRPYKDSWPHMKAMNEIVKNKGIQFDPIIVDAFVCLSEKFMIISNNHNYNKSAKNKRDNSNNNTIKRHNRH